MARRAAWPPRITHHSSGQERVVIRGKPYYLGPIGSVQAKERYLELVKKCEEQGLHKPPDVPKKRRPSAALTVAEVVERHGRDAAARYDPKGREAAQFDYACVPLLAKFPALPAARFGSAQLELVRDEMVRLGWKRGVINRRVIRIRTLWRWAERKALVPPGSWSALRVLEPLPPNDRRVKDAPKAPPPSWADFAKACRHCCRQVRDMLLVQLFGGMRPQDVRGMLAGEVDRGDPEAWVYRPATHKNSWRGHVREVAIGPRARAVLAKHLDGKRPQDHVFPSGYRKGGATRGYRDDAYARALARACERAEVTPFPPGALRHLARQRATRAGGLEEARAMLGHKTVTTTAHEYAAGVDLQLAREAARKVG